MPNFNNVVFSGNLARDPVLRKTGRGTSVLGFTLAASKSKKDKTTGAVTSEVIFLDVQAWGSAADEIAEKAKKGTPLLVEGRLKQENWDDKTTGAKRSKLVVVLESFQFKDQTSLGNPEPVCAANTTPAANRSPQANVAHVQPKLPPQPQSDFDDVPF
jgi:single-strand DNA-binding protein